MTLTFGAVPEWMLAKIQAGSRPQGRVRARDLRAGDLIERRHPHDGSCHGYVRVTGITPQREDGRIKRYVIHHTPSFNKRTTCIITVSSRMDVFDRPEMVEEGAGS
jgi:hypothetical protein